MQVVARTPGLSLDEPAQQGIGITLAMGGLRRLDAQRGAPGPALPHERSGVPVPALRERDVHRRRARRPRLLRRHRQRRFGDVE
jgi:hypothetical protein